MARDVTQLHPVLQEKIKQLQDLCKQNGLENFKVGECFRSVAEQDALYAQGRTAPGNIVTNAKGSTYSSQHQWGVAFDFFHNVTGNLYPASWMNSVIKLAKSIGLGSGADWKPVDTPHLFLPDWGSTPGKLKELYGTFDKFKASWSGYVAPSTPPPVIAPKTPILKLGAKGQEVIALQQNLVRHGFAIATDGDFGPKTDAAVRAFQKAKSLVVDGSVGPATQAALAQEASKPTPTPTPPPAPTFKEYTVEVITPKGLNVRAKPNGSISAPALPKGTRVVISGEESGWGKLKNGKGFISLDKALVKKV